MYLSWKLFFISAFLLVTDYTRHHFIKRGSICGKKFIDIMKSSLAALAFTFIVGFLSALAEEVQECGENEIFSNCVTACPNYCNQKSGDSTPCILMCREGCTCKEGYIKEAYDSSTCVNKSSCKDIPTCPDNQVYRVCDRKLRYCGQPEGSETKICRIGCGCKQHQVLESNNSDHCVYETECRNKTKKSLH